MKVNVPDPVQLSLIPPRNIDALIYGVSGTGKTVFASLFEPPVLFLDSDNGVLSLMTSNLISQAQRDQIYPLPITDTSSDPHVKGPVGWLTVKAIMDTVHKSKGVYLDLPVRTVVLDSLTTMSEFCMTYVLSINGKQPNAQPSLPDYQRQMKELLDVIHIGVATPCNFICLAHQQFVKDELSGRIWCLPLVTGKLAQNLPAYFDEVYYAQARETGGKYKYTLLTKPDGLVVAKSRLDLDAVIPTDPTQILTKLGTLRQSAQAAQVAFAGQKGGGATQAAQKLGLNS
jgi:hypothetical protein